MRLFVALALTALIAACGNNASTAQIASATPSLDLRWSNQGDKGSVTPSAPVALSAIFEPFGSDEEPSLCFSGDINQVCALLSTMSKRSVELYNSGDHGVAALKGCRIQGYAKVVDANIETSNDYESGAVVHNVTIAACKAD